jgi:hypothetical protein
MAVSNSTVQQVVSGSSHRYLPAVVSTAITAITGGGSVLAQVASFS